VAGLTLVRPVEPCTVFPSTVSPSTVVIGPSARYSYIFIVLRIFVKFTIGPEEDPYADGKITLMFHVIFKASVSPGMSAK
jgi:hypothetical protein